MTLQRTNMITLLPDKINRLTSRVTLQQLIESNLQNNNLEHNRAIKRPISFKHIDKKDFEIYLRRLYALGYKSRVFQEYLRYQFECVYQPAWFGSVIWYPYPTNYLEAEKEARHFNNKLFNAIKRNNIKTLNKPRIIWLHERTNEIINPYSRKPIYKRAYHSHFHLEAVSGFHSAKSIDKLIQNEVRPKFKKLTRKDTTFNKAIVVLEWNYDRHCSYNAKDYFKRNLDDNDLVLDYRNSDLSMAKQVKGLLL
jgi:hypothetical protein